MVAVLDTTKVSVENTRVYAGRFNLGFFAFAASKRKIICGLLLCHGGLMTDEALVYFNRTTIALQWLLCSSSLLC
jgi:hypothetical protein